jgi:hypothetical protein
MVRGGTIQGSLPIEDAPQAVLDQRRQARPDASHSRQDLAGQVDPY